MKSLLHQIVIEEVIYGNQRHSLMMRHCGVDNYAAFTFRTALTGIVDGIKKAEPA